MKCPLTTSKAASRRSRPSWLRVPIAPRRRLIASVRSSRSAMSLSRLAQHLDEFVVGAQIDRAEPLALLAQVLELALDLDAAGQRRVGLEIGERGEAGRLAVELGRDRVAKLLAPHARAFEALLGSGALLAGGAHRFERLAGGAVGVGQRGFGQRERVGGLLARGFRLAMLVGERAPGAGEIGRRVVERRPFLLRLRLAFGEFGDAALRLGKPLAPGRALGGDRARAARRAPAFRARSTAPRRALRRKRRAPAPQPRAPRRAPARRARPAQAHRARPRRSPCARRLRCARRRRGRRPPRPRRGATASAPARARTGRMRRAPRRRPRAPRAPGRAIPPRGRRLRATRARRIGRFGAQAHDDLARGLRFALEVAEPVLFLEAPRGRRRRFGGRDEAVPAPEIAFERDQPLAGLERAREALSVRPRDHADLGEAARQRGRRGDAHGQRLGAFRQRRIVAGRPSISDQCAGAASSIAASRSSPSAAPSAAS